MISLLIADDHHILRSGLRQLCEVSGGFVVVAEADNGLDAVRLARELRPDVILMDIRMPGLGGVEAVTQIHQENAGARILMLTMYSQDQYVINALRAGASGYLLKNCTEADLFAAIHSVSQGKGWLDPTITNTVLLHLSHEPSPEMALNEQELEILRMVAHGQDNRTIAEQRHLSPGRVANLLSDMFERLGVSNRTEAALLALRRGWASLDPDE